VKLHVKLFLALAFGIVLGTLLSPYAAGTWIESVNLHVLRPIGQLFLRLIFMVVVPLVVSALIIGVYELGRRRDLGGVAGRTLLFTVILSSASVVIGLAAVNLIRPGVGLGMTPPAGTAEVRGLEASASAATSFSSTLVELVPRNPLDAAVRALDGQMLALMVFALIFGVALSRVDLDRAEARPLIPMLEQIFEASMRVVGWAMWLAPLAVFAIVFGTTLTFGVALLRPLALYVGTVVAGLIVQQVVVYAFLLKTVTGRSPVAFFRACREVYLYAFSTASSNATLPLSIQTAEQRIGLPPHISRFVLTVGSTANQNGTALFEGVTVMFLAQAYGIDLSLGEQARVMVMSIVAGIGTAGVPGGSLPMVLIVAQSVGIPADGMALVLGVDRFLDMCRTVLNVSGDLVIAALVSGRPALARTSAGSASAHLPADSGQAESAPPRPVE
jgi:DAACS family dicarboxylate/amino acid:cation (Na+ or H+) symporter